MSVPSRSKGKFLLLSQVSNMPLLSTVKLHQFTAAEETYPQITFSYVIFSTFGSSLHQNADNPLTGYSVYSKEDYSLFYF